MSNDKAIQAGALALGRLLHEDSEIQALPRTERQAIVNHAACVIEAAGPYIVADVRADVDRLRGQLERLARNFGFKPDRSGVERLLTFYNALDGHEASA